MKLRHVLLTFYFLSFISVYHAQDIIRRDFTYAKKDSIELKAYVFTSEMKLKKKNNPAIILFYGDGWSAGEPSWSFERAGHFAELGFVAIAAQYRLSNRKNISPLDAMEDTRDIIIWCRQMKNVFRVDPNKLVGYGWSAGGQLVISAAISGDKKHEVSSSPNALVLISPALSLVTDKRFNELLINKIDVGKISPDKNVRTGLPPTIIFQGRNDSITPLRSAEVFAERMKEKGNICELIIYNNVGHLLAPLNEPENEVPHPDPEIQANAFKKADDFLKKLGYIK
jgi:acetyl esterase